LLALAGRFAAASPIILDYNDIDNDNEPQAQQPASHQQPNRAYLTAFSSGTGIAGVLGYAYVTLFHYWMGLSFASILVMANIFPLMYSIIFFSYLGEAPSPHDTSTNTSRVEIRTHGSRRDFLLIGDDDADGEFDDERGNKKTSIMGVGQRCGGGGGCIPGPPIVERASSTGCFEMHEAASHHQPQNHKHSSWTKIINSDNVHARGNCVQGSNDASTLQHPRSNFDYQPVSNLSSMAEYPVTTTAHHPEGQANSRTHISKVEVSTMTCWEKTKLVASLWPVSSHQSLSPPACLSGEAEEFDSQNMYCLSFFFIIKYAILALTCAAVHNPSFFSVRGRIRTAKWNMDGHWLPRGR
jgi:hypothetical protein